MNQHFYGKLLRQKWAHLIALYSYYKHIIAIKIRCLLLSKEIGTNADLKAGEENSLQEGVEFEESEKILKTAKISMKMITVNKKSWLGVAWLGSHFSGLIISVSPVEGAITGTSLVSWLDLPLQRTPTSSLWEQSVLPQIPCLQSRRDVSDPSHWTSSRRIRPTPSPKVPSATTSAWPLKGEKSWTAVFSESCQTNFGWKISKIMNIK